MKEKVLTKNSFRAALSGHTTLIAFVLFVLMAGSNSVAVRFSDLELPPFWGAASRFALAAVIFWAIVLIRRIPLPRGRALIGSLLYGAVGIGAAFALAYWSLVRVQAGMASIFLAFVPLVTVFLAAAHGLEPLSWRKVAGAVIAVGGIALIVSGGLSKGLAIPVLLVLIGFPFAMAEGAVIVKLFFPHDSPAATNAVSLSVGALMLAGLSLLTGEKWSLPAAANTWAAFGYLVIVGSVLVFYLWLFILARWPASRTSYGFVLMPLVGISISVWLTGEVMTASFVVGAAVMLAGVWLGAIRHSPGKATIRLAPALEVAPCTELAESAADC
jgi:drug/metabolite transporter (DMT)-like permease